jgi:N-acyl-D-aspartate/D-glutamate deacylase
VLCDIAVRDELRTVFRPRPGADDQESWELRRDVWRDQRAIVGASDAGAHLDMLSTFNFSTSMLKGARDHELMAVEETVHYLTDVPARLYGLRERGRIAEGWHGDIVVFDANTVGPGPIEWRNDMPAGAGRLYGGALGVDHVLVNGTEVVQGTEVTGETPGVVFRSGRDTDTVEAR